MEIKFTSDINKNYDTKILGVFDGKKLSKLTEKCDKNLNGLILKTVKNSNFTGKVGDVIDIFSENIMLVGLGKQTEFDDKKLHKIGGIISSHLLKIKKENVILMLDNFEDEKNFSVIYGAVLKAYKFDKYKTVDCDKNNIVFNVYSQNPKKSAEDFKDVKAVIDGIITTRNLANEPSNILNTTTLISEVKKLSKFGMKVEVLDEKNLKKIGANLILAVGSGSKNPPYIAVMKYTGNKKSKNTIALVGKGLCFDSGGVCIKPSKGMDEMKSDMTGAATVVGIMESIAKRKLPVNVVGIIGIAENMPDGASYKPGDVIKSLSGKTVEVLDTDAEGRLVLADCLTYAVKEIKPQFIIDFATLTGAVVVALGDETTGLFSNDKNLVQKIEVASEESCDDVWQLPLGKKFADMIKSDIADVKNLGEPSRHAGSITAAEFLKFFVEDVPWAHLDIAGTAWTTKGNDIAPKGMTGVGVALLNKLIEKM